MTEILELHASGPNGICDDLGDTRSREALNEATRFVLDLRCDSARYRYCPHQIHLYEIHVAVPQILNWRIAGYLAQLN